ncbi:MAG: Leucine--tRNA ligase [Alphaproteobacteria bacterium MarineAlpha9_Bin4]|nr:MAG: Leucine--tRNA ligase [Alphaproteobacteria bacterium MarineAlpha9_Bin4]
MNENKSQYHANAVEKYWQDIWDKKGCFLTKNQTTKKNYYVLEMFPYPSGRIHMGHVRVYTLGDVLARYKRACGFNVLHPMGWDAFGMPAENAAFENNIHPRDWTNKNIKNMKDQLKSMGISYDWTKEISTCDPEYIKQQQKLFIKFFKAKLLYKKEAWANWDPIENTVLANEQVIDGKGWRSGVKIERKLLSQWFLSITKFSNDLLTDLESLKNWPENVKTMQKNWIGKSVGAEISFQITKENLIESYKNSILVYTTRPDTIFGTSFIALAPDHQLSDILSKSNNGIKEFIKKWESTFANEEMIEKAPKEGVFTNMYVKHPFTEKKIPIYIANYVLSTYGTGAIFGVPAHDERDFVFAKKYDLPIIKVVDPEDSAAQDLPYTGAGTLINSEFLNNKNSLEAKSIIISKLKEINLGEKKTKYRLRDWCASRQRYWGCPIPIIYREDGEVIPVDESDLPVLLPDDVDFSKKNGNPLNNHATWKYTTCKKTGLKAVRETDTLDTFFDSSWYFIRFVDPFNKNPINKKLAEEWCPVHQYVGGIEHAVLHLLYSRFFTKALSSLGEFKFKEPFKGLFCQGMVCHKTYQDSENNWVYPEEVITKNANFFHKDTGNKVKELRSEKMSKSKKNIVDPVNIIQKYGADTARFFMLSDSPPERKLEWTSSGIDGSNKYLLKVWRFFNNLQLNDIIFYENYKYEKEKNKNLIEKTHFYIDKITKSLDNFQYNVAVAQIREFSNIFFSFDIDNIKNEDSIALKFSLTKWIILISPMVPHLAEELWKVLGYKDTLVSEQNWPIANLDYIKITNVNIVVQINGKKKFVYEIPKDLSVEETKEFLSKKEAIKAIIKEKEIKKIIVIPNKIFSLVI